MGPRTLSSLMAEFRETLRPGTGEAEAMRRFQDFLAGPGGLLSPSAPGKSPRIVDSVRALRCFHFSQYLDWYLVEKEAESSSNVESARQVLSRFNRWLRAQGKISEEEFEENRESIEVETGGEPEEEEGAGTDLDEGDSPEAPPIPTEQDFYVPGEYATTLSGEFVITKVQEGILYAVRAGEEREIGPILVERMVSSGHRVGDRVYLSLGKAGRHWNLLHLGRRRPT